MDDNTANRLAEALERLEKPTHTPAPQLTGEQQAAIEQHLYSDPTSPFRRAQERKREYLAREDGRRAHQELSE